jgi:UDP-2-acetamido-2-deoxy-ribo-hexuluronate aminotransferase
MRNNMQFVDLHTQQLKIKDNILKRIKKVLGHGQYINGPEISELELELTKFTDAHAICCGSGTDALIASLMSYGVTSGDYVITTPFTFSATANAIKILGATPIFVDIDHNTFNIDPDAVERRLQENYNNFNALKIKGIIAVDIFGCPANYERLNDIAENYNLFLIADAAQSFGAVCDFNMVGTLADITTTSFFPAKPLGCYGDGGAIFTKDDKKAEILRSIIQHGQGDDKYQNVRLGFNGRMDTFQAAILLEKIELYKNEFPRRNDIALKYMNGLKNLYKFQMVPSNCISSYAQFSLLTDDREFVRNKLKNKGIPTAIYYPTPLHKQESMYSDVRLPITEYICDHIFSIPVHPYLEDYEVQKIIDELKEVSCIMGDKS